MLQLFQLSFYLPRPNYSHQSVRTFNCILMDMPQTSVYGLKLLLIADE